MTWMDNLNDDISTHFSHGLGPDFWERCFREARTPLVLQDLTEVRQAIVDVQATGVKDFRAWLDAHPEFVNGAIAAIRIIDANDKAIALSGAGSLTVFADSLPKMVIPETLGTFKDLLTALSEKQTHYEGQGQYRTLNGDQIYTLNTAPLPLDEDEPAILLLAMSDITDLKQTQLDLKHSEARYRLVVETARDVILCHDLTGRITYMNQSGRDLCGWRDPGTGTRLLDLIPDDLHEKLRHQNLLQLESDDATRLFETRFMDIRGAQIPMEVSACLMPGGISHNGQPQVLVVARNISERKLVDRERRQLETRVQDTQRLESLGALAGGVAFDFNNLLVTILGNAELLLQEKSPQSRKAGLQEIITAAQQAADLCRQMQAYAREGEFALETVDFNRLVKGISKLLQTPFSWQSNVVFELAEDLPSTMVDSAQMRQVLINLVSNAAESQGLEGGQITVSTGVRDYKATDLKDLVTATPLVPGRYVYCRVADQGCGMDPVTRKRLFDPFFTTKVGGRGLGLSASLGIVLRHDGGFLLTTTPGRGSTLTLLLPPRMQKIHKAKPPRPCEGPTPEMLKNMSGRTVLVVDDDAGVRLVVEGFLRRLGCKVLIACNGLEATQVFGRRLQEIDAVLLDMAMKGMDGLATTEQLRIMDPDVKIVITSGLDERDVLDRFCDVEVSGFIPKPYSYMRISTVMGMTLMDG